MFTGCATWLDVPELTWKVSNLLDLVDFGQIGSSAPGGDNIAGFAQLADDIRATILWLHENEGVEGYFQADPVFENTCGAQREIVKDITAGDDTTPPTLTWLTVPDDITESTDARFTFSVDDAITVLCTLDADEPEPCTSPKEYTSLSSGDHTFTITAVDAANNWASIQDEWTILIPGELVSSSTPIRLVDTRVPWVAPDARFTATGPVAGGTMIEVPIAGRGTIPIGAQAAVLNVTVDGAVAPGFLTVFPCGPMPLASSLNYGLDHPVANELITKLSPNGTVCIYALTTTHVIVDAVGHVPADSAYEPVAPSRLVDTRVPWSAADGEFTATGPVAGGTMIEVPIAGRGGIAADAEAAVLNVTVDGAVAPGFLTVFPCGPMPLASSLNYGLDHPVANELITKLSPNGTVCIYALTTTHVIVDAVGSMPAELGLRAGCPEQVGRHPCAVVGGRRGVHGDRSGRWWDDDRGADRRARRYRRRCRGCGAQRDRRWCSGTWVPDGLPVWADASCVQLELWVGPSGGQRVDHQALTQRHGVHLCVDDDPRHRRCRRQHVTISTLRFAGTHLDTSSRWVLVFSDRSGSSLCSSSTRTVDRGARR